MCGICGQIHNDPSRPVDVPFLKQMTSAIHHRGPDSDGTYVNGNVGLGVRRLAVIDLVTGDQPMSNEVGTIWVVLNGEIYNYRELRSQLESRGHTFRSSSDTEVIVHLYEEFGPECVRSLWGMFAFAVWDERHRRLLLARDRVGQKPLYYAECDGTFLFGSELKCVLQHPALVRDVDLEAVHHYLTLQYIPDARTGFKAVHKLPPAHCLEWQGGRARIERYWDLSYEPKWRLTPEEMEHEVRNVVGEAVRSRLVSDVPLGAHLSGGIDSSVVVALMASMTDRPVKTFSIGFEEDAYSELPYARQVAARFGTEHHEFMMKADAIDVLPKLVRHFDEPFADPAAIPTWYLAQMTREHVTVALNGDGGDEAFAGYRRYYADALVDAYALVPGFLRQGVLDPLLERLPSRADRPMEHSYIKALRRLPQAARIPQGASIVRWGGYFDEDSKSRLYNDQARQSFSGTPSAALLEEVFHRAKAASRLDRTLYTDVHTYLPGALLTKVDRTTMAHSLEARSPFLDHRVLEMAARLPRRLKVRGQQTKVMLRKAFADLLPAGIGSRLKMGFGVPLALWFRGALYEPAKELLLSPDTRLRAYLRSEEMGRLIEENRQGQEDHGKRIWTLLNLEVWLREYGGRVCL